MPKPLDPVKLAKEISKNYRVPLPRVAAIMQKYPLDGPGLKKAFEECKLLAATQMDKDLKAMFNL